MDRPEIVAALGLASLAGGAAGLRIEGAANLRAMRSATDAPVIGLIKRDLVGSDVRITPLLSDIDDLAQAGAGIIAVDATQRPRPVPVADLLARIRARGCLAMADCATEEDARMAHELGFDILGSTLSGYTGGPVPDGPDLRLVAALRGIGGFVMAEGRYNRPEDVAGARQHGADAVTVGTAITRTEIVTSWFAHAAEDADG
jgi:putative N-acetylmannosamine-6-phosphate epimerase